MSAYLSRLIQRFSPPTADDGGTALQPFIRSRSPIAAIDQRLGIDESLGHGLGDLGNSLDEPMVESPEPGPIQRKAATVATPTLAAPPPSATVSAAKPIPTPASPTRAASESASQATEFAPRREPMDPGPLFAPFALHYDAAANPTSSVAPSTVEFRTVERIVERHEQPTALLTPSPPRVRIVPWVAFDRNTPAVAFDRNTPASPDFPRPVDAPFLEPGPVPHSYVEHRIVPLLVEPRRPTPAPFVPEHEPTPVAQADAPQSPSTRTAAESASSKPAATPRSPAVPTPTRGKLHIDSISQIGPLARHFPNRRHFRLRYR